MGSVLPETLARPHWPSRPIDPTGVQIHYNPPADELTLHFPGRPRRGTSEVLSSPGGEAAAVIVDDATGDIVGVQVMPLLAGAVRTRPDWAVLAWGALTASRFDEPLLRSAVEHFLTDVHELFERYWRPAPPVEEQWGSLPRPRREGGREDA